MHVEYKIKIQIKNALLSSRQSLNWKQEDADKYTIINEPVI